MRLHAPLPVIDRYLLREALSGMLIVGGVLMLIILGNTLVRNLSEAAKGDLPVDEVFHMLLLQSLNYSVLLGPLAVFLGLMLALGRFYRDSEMAAFAAGGIGPGRLYQSVLYFMLPLFMALMGGALYVAPWAAQEGYAVVDRAQRTAEIIGIHPGRFNESKDGARTVFVDRISADRRDWQDVFIRDNRQNQLFSAARARQRVDPDSGDRYVVLEDGYRYQGVPGQADYQVLHYKEYAVRIGRGVSTKARDKLDAKPTSHLLHSTKPSEIAELQWRLSMPISAILLALLAVPLSYSAPRQGRHGQMLTAILIYMVYENSLSVAKVWVTRGVLPPLVGLWWVHLLLAALVIYLVGRRLGWRWLKGHWREELVS